MGDTLMDDDDAFAKTQPHIGRLEDLSIRELHARIGDLKAEIVEMEAIIKAKEASKSAADLFFKPQTK
jgi:uncharacterized small protein (DUF1192 family)